MIYMIQNDTNFDGIHKYEDIDIQAVCKYF